MCVIVYFSLLNRSMTKSLCPVYRVNWLKTRAQNERWKEAWDLVRHEMEWLILGYHQKADAWQCRADISEGLGKVGHRCYALQQKATWQRFIRHAQAAFDKIKSVA